MNEELLDSLSSEQPAQEIQQETVPEQTQEQVEQKAEPQATEQPEASTEEKSSPPPGLLEERAKRKAAQEEASNIASKVEELEQKINQYQQNEQYTQEQLNYFQGLESQIKEIREKTTVSKEDEIPDFETNPAEHLYAQNQKLQKQLEELSNGQNQFNEQNQQQQQMRNAINEISNQERVFANKHPDYQNAYDHLKSVKERELKAYGLSDDQVQHELNRSAYQTGMAALQQGKNPGQVVYELAKVHGYTTPDANPAPANTQQEQDKAALETIEKGLEASKTLDSSGKPTVDDLVNADDDSFVDLLNSAMGESFPSATKKFGQF